MERRSLPTLALVSLLFPALAGAHPPGVVLLADPNRPPNSAVVGITFAVGDALVTEGGMARDTVRIWDRGTGRLRHTLSVTDVRGVCVSPDGRTLAVSAARDLCLFDIASGRRLALFPRAAPGTLLCFAPDGKSLWLTEGTGVAQRAVSDGTVLRQLAVGGALAVSPDGTRLAALEAAPDKADGYVLRLWDLNTGQKRGLVAEEKRLPQAEGPYPLAFSPDGNLLAWSRNDRRLHISDLARGKELPWLDNPDDERHAVFSPDGRLVARTAASGELQVLEVSSGRERLRLATPARVTCVTFTPDGRLLALGHADGVVSLWDAAGPGADPVPRDLEVLWTDLAGDGSTAHRAICALAARPMALPKLEERLRTFKQPKHDAQVARWIRELDDDDFQTRERATANLRKMGSAVRPDLTAALQAHPSLEAALRLHNLLADVERPVPDSTTLRALRALEAVERAGTPEAREALTRLAKQAGDPLVRAEAEEGARRLAGR